MPYRDECLWLPTFSPCQHYFCRFIHLCDFCACLLGLQMENTLVYVVHDPELHTLSYGVCSTYSALDQSLEFRCIYYPNQ